MILFFADSHAQASAWAGRPIYGDVEFGLAQIYALAVEHGVKMVVGCGDLIDKQRNRSGPPKMLAYFITQLQKAGIDFSFIQGQHDFDDPPWLEGVGHAQHLHKKTVRVGDRRLYGLDFTRAEDLKAELDAVPVATSILVCHQTWGDWMGEIASPQADFAHVSRVSTVVSGDLHQFKLEAFKDKDGKSIRCVSPGSVCMQAIDEPDKHFAVLIDERLDITPKRLKSRPFIDWPPLLTAADVETFMAQAGEALLAATAIAEVDELPESMHTPLLRVTYNRRLENLVGRIQKTVGQRAHLFWRPRESELEKVAQPVGSVKGRAMTALTALPQAVDRDKEPEVFSLLETVLKAEDKNAAEIALSGWRRDFLAKE